MKTKEELLEKLFKIDTRKKMLREIKRELDILIKKGITSTELPYEKFIILMDELGILTDSLIYSPPYERCSDKPIKLIRVYLEKKMTF
jgi:hypothetical protein